jgi:hypothetical protein
VSDSPHEPHRIRGYAGSMAAFGLSIAGAALAGRRGGRRLPDRYDPADLVLGALATHKFSRLLTKEGVTTPIRAPFTDFHENIGSAEVMETPKTDSAPKHVVGELISCPFCVAPWIASAYVAGLAFAPRTARAWAAVFSMVAGSDFLQHGYGHVRED